jgi:hypothetical protein
VVVLRGRVFQVGAAISMALLGLLAVALGWAAMQYRQFSADISQSRSRLPASVDRALPAAPRGALDAPEVTLVRYTSALSTAGAVLFFTDPKRHLMSFLALPPSTHIGSQPLARLDVPETIAALRASTAVRVGHVALIDRSDVGSLVSGLGRITITNPALVRATQPDGRVRTFSPGRISLDGPGAVAYLRGAGPGEPLEGASMAVLGGTFKELLRPNSLSTLEAAGSALAGSASTDLTDADVLGLAYLRVNGGTALQCHLQRKVNLTSTHAASVLAQFLGIERPGAACTPKPFAGRTLAPPKALVRVLQSFGWRVFGFGSGLALLLMLLIGAGLMTVGRGPRRSAPARLPLVPRSDAPPSPDVVWHAGAATPQGPDGPRPATAAPEAPHPQTEAPAHEDQRAWASSGADDAVGGPDATSG